ncbi:DUF2905 domain-containing protein [Halonatronum saccharophilum]|uniref:DUF2905 domain-containing protein n=1 Tax=Halonatronum saccharophilum TaxID=150060 RepID=UPI0004838B5F|nr:DUF2905 domain-containing protein [Halonatronum saccharophilum]
MRNILGGQLILIGLIIVGVGLFIKLGLPIGRLPGDIYIKGDNFVFYFPITTGILISLIVSLILRLFK